MSKYFIASIILAAAFFVSCKENECKMETLTVSKSTAFTRNIEESFYCKEVESYWDVDMKSEYSFFENLKLVIAEKDESGIFPDEIVPGVPEKCDVYLPFEGNERDDCFPVISYYYKFYYPDNGDGLKSISSAGGRGDYKINFNYGETRSFDVTINENGIKVVCVEGDIEAEYFYDEK